MAAATAYGPEPTSTEIHLTSQIPQIVEGKQCPQSEPWFPHLLKNAGKGRTKGAPSFFQEWKLTQKPHRQVGKEGRVCPLGCSAPGGKPETKGGVP